jgi:hypothetical protein
MRSQKTIDQWLPAETAIRREIKRNAQENDLLLELLELVAIRRRQLKHSNDAIGLDAEDVDG